MHVSKFFEALRVPEIHRFIPKSYKEELVELNRDSLPERHNLFLSLLLFDKILNLSVMALELSV